jgi:hypothetical protein
VTGAVLLPFFTGFSMLIAVPTGVKFFNWIGTTWGGAISFPTPMLFALGFLFSFLLGGLTGVMLAAAPIDFHVSDSYFVVAHLHYVMFGGSVFALYAGLYHRWPKITRRRLDERWGKVHFWMTLVGFHLTFFVHHILGLKGMPRRVADYLGSDGFTGLNQLSTLGSFLLGASTLPFLWNAVQTLRGRLGTPAGDDPWRATRSSGPPRRRRRPRTSRAPCRPSGPSGRCGTAGTPGTRPWPATGVAGRDDRRRARHRAPTAARPADRWTTGRCRGGVRVRGRFHGVIAGIYRFTVYEDAGTVMLVGAGELALWIAAYRWRQRDAQRDRRGTHRRLHRSTQREVAITDHQRQTRAGHGRRVPCGTSPGVKHLCPVAADKGLSKLAPPHTLSPGPMIRLGGRGRGARHRLRRIACQPRTPDPSTTRGRAAPAPAAGLRRKPVASRRSCGGSVTWNGDLASPRWGRQAD